MKTEIGRNGTSNWSSGPMWVRRRSLGKNKPQGMQASHDLIRRLGLEATLGEMGDTYNYFHMDWNQKGTLLAVAQTETDQNDSVSVWDVFKRRKVCKVETTSSFGHATCVKFLPDNDTKVVTSLSEGGLILVDLVTKESSYLITTSCCDIAVHSSEPNLIWSVTADWYVICSDIRQAHTCSQKYEFDSARRIAINPLRSEMLAVGFRLGETQLIDRRALKSGASSACTAHFQPVYLQPLYYDDNVWPTSYGLIGLAFNSDGSELLVSIHGEQVYLFNTYEPWEKYGSFDLSIKPLLSNELDLTSSCNHSELRPYSYLNELRKQSPVEMQDELKAFCDEILSRNSTFKGPSNIIDYINKSLEEELPIEANSNQQATPLLDKNIIDYLNVLLSKVKNCPDLYRARAIAFIRRARRGDYCQALQDCCCALALKPLDFQTIRCLSSILIKLENEEDVCRLLDFVEDAIKEFGDHDDLTKSREMLLAYKEMKENESVTDEENETGSDSESSYSGSSYSESAHSESAHSELAHHMKADPVRKFDYSCRFHSAEAIFRCHQVKFFGSNDEFIIGGGETAFHVWDKNTGNIVKSVDTKNVRYVLPHPTICMVATSGPLDAVKLWSPIGRESEDVDV